MIPPPPQGDPLTLVPSNYTNPQAWACVIGWNAFTTMATFALTDYVNEAQALQGVPI